MPYNTRRKSLSLSELGIAIPKRARSGLPVAPLDPAVDVDGPPIKKPKRSHDGSMSPPMSSLMSPPSTTNIRVKDEKPRLPAELSPPPSPPSRGHNKVDIEGIHDDIVIATIQQLETTGNRPLFVRELGAILAHSLPCVEKSANPTALISSRLTQYLGRSWPAISPCPLAKDLSTAHPRRLYFYLTTMPRQPVPEAMDTFPKAKRIISPSLSSASAIDEDERYHRQRTALSPSPEVDLSSPELDDNSDHPGIPGRPFSGRNSLTRASSTSSHLANSRRAASPQLEKEERDFKQTANALYEQAQQRRKSSQAPDIIMDEAEASGAVDTRNVTKSIEGDDGVSDATTLFGHLKSPSHGHMEFSSPVIRAEEKDLSGDETILSQEATRERNDSATSTAMPEDAPKHSDALRVETGGDVGNLMLPEAAFGWDTLLSPESVALAELDDMFEAY